jgi:hypothetical protein
MQQLASFNTSTVSAASETAAQNAATAASLNSTQVDSAAKLASLVTQVFTETYQRRRLLEDLRSADAPVANITQGLESVVNIYIRSLHDEQQTVTARYQAVGGTDDTAVLLLLDRAYSDDVADIDRRRKAAAQYQEALKTVREGHHQLVTGAHHLSAKELNVALQPYTSKLMDLVTALQKSK